MYSNCIHFKFYIYWYIFLLIRNLAYKITITVFHVGWQLFIFENWDNCSCFDSWPKLDNSHDSHSNHPQNGISLDNSQARKKHFCFTFIIPSLSQGFDSIAFSYMRQDRGCGKNHYFQKWQAITRNILLITIQ